MVRGIRGATTADTNTKEEILAKSRELLDAVIKKNDLKIEDIASIIFSVTDDLDAGFPALAVREMGLSYTPLFCTQEMRVQNSLKKCIRLLVHVNTDIDQKNIKHVFLHGAQNLRPDLVAE